MQNVNIQMYYMHGVFCDMNVVFTDTVYETKSQPLLYINNSVIVWIDTNWWTFRGERFNFHSPIYLQTYCEPMCVVLKASDTITPHLTLSLYDFITDS